jgi:hypothetical protein
VSELGSYTETQKKFDPIQEIIWGNDLESIEFPETKWLVQEVVPEGLTMLAGPPKLGKSILATQLCLSVAEGTKFVGEYACEQRKSLFITWEDPPRRVQERIKIMNGYVPQCLGLLYSPIIAGNDLEWLDSVLTNYSDLGLIVFDTAAYLRSDTKLTNDAYVRDVKFFQPFHNMSNERHISFVFITHTNQNEKLGDKFSRVQGTTGQIGTADTILVMEGDRKGEALLSGAGRDLPHIEIKLALDTESLCWAVTEDQEPSTICEKIKEFLRDKGCSRPRDIAEALGVRSVGSQLSRLVNREEIIKKGTCYDIV